ncbi:hypothetical protein [Burkholderia semiarida]|uniref:hypothetical protein n=1 Tax=Burkholderia semiarida TaxID=2843303 RepID=UPI0038779C20
MTLVNLGLSSDQSTIPRRAAQAQEHGLLGFARAAICMSACHDTARHNAAIHFLLGINARPGVVFPVVLSPDIRSTLIRIH